MNDLKKIVQTNELDPKDGQIIIERFGTYEQVAQEWKAKADAIVVTDRGQTTEMAMAREARKKFSNMRIELEKARKAIGEPAYRKYKAVNAVAAYIQALIQPIEDHLRLQEDFIKNDDARIEAEKKIEEERKIEAERIAREEAERKEQERIRVENEKLKKEAEERERAMATERKKAEDQRLALEEKARKEREAAQAKLNAEKEERERAEQALQNAKDEQVRKEKEAKELERLRVEKEKLVAQEALKAPDKDKYREYIRHLLDVPAPIIEDQEIKDKVTKIVDFLTRQL